MNLIEAIRSIEAGTENIDAPEMVAAMALDGELRARFQKVTGLLGRLSFELTERRIDNMEGQL